jgi:hypothetical protein
MTEALLTQTPKANTVLTDDAAGTENRQGCHGEEAGGSLVLDDAQGMGFRNVNKVRLTRGKAWNRRWCEVERRANEWVSR